MAVLKFGGITRAARQLHMVQSAVSQAVKQLEDECGLELLERRPDGVRPTPAGEALGRHAQRVLEAVDRLDADMASYRGHATGVVRVGLLSAIAPMFMAPLIRAIDQRLPDVTLRVVEGVASDLVESVRLERLDVVVLLWPVDCEGLSVVETGQLPLSLIVPPDHPLGSSDEVAAADLAEESWIAFAPSNPGRRWLDEIGRRGGFRPIVGSEVDTLTQLKAFLEAGRGISLLPAGVVEFEVLTQRLQAIPITETPTIRHGYAFRAGDGNPAIEQVRAVVGQELGRLPLMA